MGPRNERTETDGSIGEARRHVVTGQVSCRVESPPTCCAELLGRSDCRWMNARVAIADSEPWSALATTAATAAAMDIHPVERATHVHSVILLNPANSVDV